MILAVDADVDALPTDKSQAQLDALNPKPEGVLFYNATTKKMQFFNGTAWIVLGEGSGGSIGVPPGANASWESDTTVTGNPVSAWLSKDGTVTLAQGTGSQRPAVTAGAFGSTQGLTFDGVNDHLTIATKVVTDTSGSAISVVFKTPATVVGPGVLVSQSNVAVANDWFEIGIGADGKLYVENNNAGAKLTIKGSTVLAPSTVYDLMLCYDGTDYFLLLKGVEENPLTIVNIGSFAWFGRVGGTTSFTVGATITSAGVQRPLAGVLGGIYLFDTDLTA
jgi:hypothetical protein